MLNRMFLCIIPPTPPRAYPFSRSIHLISITMIIHVPAREAKHIRPVSGTVHGVPHPYENFNFHTEICKKSLASLARRRRISTPNSTYLINDIVHQLFWVFLALLPKLSAQGLGGSFAEVTPGSKSVAAEAIEYQCRISASRMYFLKSVPGGNLRCLFPWRS